MQGTPHDFWGKLRLGASGAPEAWHPLSDHCADVAACCEALLAQTLLRRRLARLAGLDDLTQVQVARLCVLAALHDAGKVNLGFQAKSSPESRRVAGHVKPLFALLASSFRESDSVSDAIGVEQLLEWGPQGLILASFAHHGRPLKAGDHAVEADPRLWQSTGALDPIKALAALRASAMTWFPAAAGTAAPLPDSPELEHAFCGLVTLADWLGSDETLFPFSTTETAERISFARERALTAVRAVGLDAGPARAQLSLPSGWFGGVFGFPPRGVQQAMLDLPVPASGGVAVLEAETGSGKTEAAMARFLALFRAGAVDGLYFALPTRTAATQIHARISEHVKKAFPEPESRPRITLAVPGYLRVDDTNDRQGDPRLAPFHSLWPDDVSDRARWQCWAAESPKRYLAGQVVVGTIDQALLSALRVRHAHLRATSLLRHLLVVDEVHASDAYMNQVLEEVLHRHVAAGGHALLMSATLGAAARSRLIERNAQPPPLSRAEHLPYPAITTAGEAGPQRARGEGTGKDVRVELTPCMGDPMAVAQRAAAAAKAGARVLVIRNTVADAIETQRALEAAAPESALLFACGGVPAPHHARFAREDRTLLDKDIEQRFGRGADAPCAVIATQTVQQSLDLDADLLITDLCPMDVLLQRIGRLHRHTPKSRPAGFESACAVVLVPDAPDLGGSVSSRTGEPIGRHGIGRVYSDLRILQATWDQLATEPELSIPARNRRYVERTTHPEALAELVKRRGGNWVQHHRWVVGVFMAEVGQAQLNLARWSKPFASQGWSSDDGHIASRLGAGDRLALFEEPFRSPFGASCGALTLPAWLAGEVGEEVRPEAVRPLAAGGVTFTFGGRSFQYDRFGLARVKVVEDGGDG